MNIPSTLVRKSTCKKCDLGYILKDHLDCIFQLLTNEFPEYNFRMQTTKCLNTAVMLLQFFVGAKGMAIVDSCDTRKVIERHQNGIDDNMIILNDLKRQIFELLNFQQIHDD